MSLNIGRALQDGVERTVSRNGLVLAVVWLALGAVNQLTYNSAIRGFLPEASRQPGLLGPSLPMSAGVAAVLLFFLYLASFVVTAVALRTFVSEETQRIPREYVTRNLGWFLVNYFVGYVVFLIVVWIGTILLIVPGIFLLVSLYFWIVFVAVEDQNFVEAFRNAWDLASGNRLSLFGLGVVVSAVGMVLYGVLFFVTFAVSPWVSLVGFSVVVAAIGVFTMATTARAYVLLQTEEGAADESAVAA